MRGIIYILVLSLLPGNGWACPLEKVAPLAVVTEQSFQNWDNFMVDLYYAKLGKDIRPQALPRFTLIQRFGNAVKLYRAGTEIKEAVGSLGSDITVGKGQDIDADQAIERVTNAIAQSHFRDQVSLDMGGKELEKSKSSWLSLMGDLGAGNIPYAETERFTNDYQAHIVALKEKYGSQYFTNSAVSKAGFDAFAMHMLAKLGHMEVPTRESVYALSLLHPITDAAIDQHENIGNAMVKLTQLLEGKVVQAETPYERLVFDLVRTIFEQYPDREHPMVRLALLELQKEQLKSVKLQGEKVSENDRVRNSLRKGSLTALLFGYLSFGKLTEKQAEYFYKAGAMLQLIDDLLDLSSDLKEGNQTVWTMAYQQKKGDLSEPMKRLLNMQKYLEVEGKHLLSELPSSKDFLKSFEFGFRLFIYSSVFDPKVANGTKRVLGHLLPLSPDRLVRVTYDTFGAYPNANDIPIFQIFDTGFLNGKFANEGNGNRSKGKGIEIANFRNPAWWLVKLSDKLHRGFTNWVNPKDGDPLSKEWRNLIFIATGSLYALDLNAQFNSLGLQGFVPVSLFYSATTYFKSPTKGIGVAMGTLALAHALAATFQDDKKKERDPLLLQLAKWLVPDMEVKPHSGGE